MFTHQNACPPSQDHHFTHFHPLTRTCATVQHNQHFCVEFIKCRVPPPSRSRAKNMCSFVTESSLHACSLTRMCASPLRNHHACLEFIPYLHLSAVPLKNQECVSLSCKSSTYTCSRTIMCATPEQNHHFTHFHSP